MIVKVADVGKFPEVFVYRPSTFYAWRHRRKNLEIFRKLGNSLLVDSEKFKELIERGKLEK